MNVLVLQCEVTKYDALQQIADDPIETGLQCEVFFYISFYFMSDITFWTSKSTLIFNFGGDLWYLANIGCLLGFLELKLNNTQNFYNELR